MDGSGVVAGQGIKTSPAPPPPTRRSHTPPPVRAISGALVTLRSDRTIDSRKCFWEVSLRPCSRLVVATLVLAALPVLISAPSAVAATTTPSACSPTRVTLSATPDHSLFTSGPWCSGPVIPIWPFPPAGTPSRRTSWSRLIAPPPPSSSLGPVASPSPWPTPAATTSSPSASS